MHGLSGHIAARETEMAGADAAEAGWMILGRAVMAVYVIYQADRQIVVMRETVRLPENFEAGARSMHGAGTVRPSGRAPRGGEDARRRK